MKRTLLIIMLFVAPSVAYGQLTATSTNSGPVTFTAYSEEPVLTIHPGGEIKCHQCKGIAKDSLIGTLIQSERDRLFKPISVGPPPSGVTISSGYLTGSTKKYAHAQQPKPDVKSVTLNADASAMWQRIDAAEDNLRQQFQVLESQRQALLIGANVPKEFWTQCATTEKIVTCAPPKVAEKKP